MDAVTRFPYIEQLFARNPSNYTYARFEEEDPTGFVRGRGEPLLEAAEKAQIQGTSKLAQIGGPEKFVNLLAELRFGLLFASLGAKVKILSDQEFGVRFATPDLHAVMPSGLELLLEVTRWSSGDADIASPLSRALDDAQLPIRVEVLRGPRLSSPAISANSRTKLELLTRDTVGVAVRALTELCAQGATSGGVEVLRCRDELCVRCTTGPVQYPDVALAWPANEEEADDEGMLATFAFERLDSGQRGYYASGATTVHVLNDEGYRKKALVDIAKKAVKAADVPPAYRSLPYVVAVQNDEFECEPGALLTALIGARCRLKGVSSRRTLLPPEIQQLAATAWRPLFEEWGYVDKPSIYMEDFGAYHREQWSRAVSGVLVLHYCLSELQWLPNPLATAGDVRLLEIGLDYSSLGVPFSKTWS